MKTKAERIDGMQKEAAKVGPSSKRDAWMLASWELEQSLTPEERTEWGRRSAACYCPSLASGRCDFCTGLRSVAADTQVMFRVDSNGRQVAFRLGYGRRWFRCGLAWAENMVATGQAVRVAVKAVA